VPFNAAIIPLIQIYYSLGDNDIAAEIIRTYSHMLEQELEYFTVLSGENLRRMALTRSDMSFASRNLMSLYSIASNFGDDELGQELMEILMKGEGNPGGMLPLR
jgi:hypothetical protein